MTTFVLIHGSYQGGWIWQPVTKRLREAGHDVYAPTLDGCGERRHQVRPGIDATTQASEIADLLFFEDLHDVGSSWTLWPCSTVSAFATS
jgi:pimeloyl-ACP methyl ester carboxylesterase